MQIFMMRIGVNIRDILCLFHRNVWLTLRQSLPWPTLPWDESTAAISLDASRPIGESLLRTCMLHREQRNCARQYFVSRYNLANLI